MDGAGERYGDFELLRLIATGGMAEIYLARHESFGGVARSVVVKRMLPQLAVRPDFVQMFLDEGRLAEKLNHPNIVQVFNLGEAEQTASGVGATNKSYFIAMEFVDGPHLGSLFAHSLRQRKPLPLELCAYVVARAADGLHYAHEITDGAGQKVGLVHRDISPQNVLVSRQGDVKVTDFGVAKASTQQTKTRTGIIKGKVAYMSPEQCLGEVVDRRTDVFALGIVLYELLTRRRLFRDKSDLLIMQKITGEDVQPPSAVNKDVDAELDAICLRALARPREQRFATAGEMAEALDAWLAQKKVGDARAQLQRWFENNAIELSLGDGSSASQPSLGAVSMTEKVRPVVNAAGPDEETAATPSLNSINSAETVSRPSPSRAAVDSIRPTMRPDATLKNERASDPRIDARNLQSEARALEKLPSRAGIEDEPTQRAPRADIDVTMQAPAWPAKPDASDPAEFTSVQRSAAIPVDGLEPRSRTPMIGIAAAVVVVLAIAVFAAVRLTNTDGTNTAAANTPNPATPTTTASTPTTPVAPVDAKAAESDGKLTIESEPPVEVLVDGQPAGKSPVTVKHAAGKATIRAIFDDQAPATEEIDVAAGEEKTVKLFARVPLNVKSTPPGARVIVAGTPEGLTPFTHAARLVPGVATKVRVELAGYAPVDETVTPDPNTAASLDVKLERNAVAHESVAKASTPPPAPLKPGTLKMRSTPWVNVRVQSNGQKFSTPGAVQVPAGRQLLVLQNPENGLTDQLAVTIPEDKEVRVVLTYEQQKNGSWKLKNKVIQ